ncbi:MAG TPA: GIY-YIG nuclease family protein [Candidatus Woesebacteria bacterium]|nr:GIY-YIG nuclease family protein [Candidatus Woesebacteria bacterium]
MPSQPGIYIFEDENKKPLYIGKSIDIKSRLKQHYEGFREGSTKAANFIPQTRFLYTRTVRNDLEAVIVEANYIKQYKPRYNAITKDGKSNIYIVFTNSPDTKIKIIHATDIQTLDLDDYKKQVFGPFTSGAAAETILKQARRIFGYCLSPFNAQNRACFNHHLDKCPGACLSNISYSNYQRHLGQIKRLLSGHFNQLNSSLYKKINRAIKIQDFEKAEIYKKQIESLQQALTSQNSSLLLKLSDASDELQYQIVKNLNHPKLTRSPYRIECYDLAHLQGDNYVGSMAVFINGRAETSLYRHFNIRGETDRSDPHAMKQILVRRFTHPEWGTPDLIVLDGGIPQLSIVSSVIPDHIPVITLAKKRETIYFYDQENHVTSISLNLEDPVLNLFRNIRDEAHRFATTFHQKQREKSFINRYT